MPFPSWPVLAACGNQHAPQAGSGGESGGVRVCYFVIGAARHIYLVTLFAKNKQANLNAAERAAAKAFIARIKAAYSMDH